MRANACNNHGETEEVYVAKPKVFFIYWLSKNSDFLLSEPRKVSETKVAKLSVHCTVCKLFWLLTLEA